MDKVKVLLCAVGGYGTLYANALLDSKRIDYQVVGIVDPMPNNYPRLAEYIEQGVPVYNTIEHFFAERSADLTVISSPIQYHAPQSIHAMHNGSHVLCEKPIAGSMDDALQMIQVSEETRRSLAIGFQLSFSSTNLQLKKELLDGKFGRIHRMKNITLWPRSTAYFSRNNWAGKIQDAGGYYIRDSVLQNATAHHLHNLLFLAGHTLHTSADIQNIQYETYRANPIETFDTAFVQLQTSDDIHITSIVSHAVKKIHPPIFEIFTEHANIYMETDERITIRYCDGTVEIREKETRGIEDGEMKKLFDCIDDIRCGQSFRSPAQSVLPHLQCIESITTSKPFDPTLVRMTQQTPTGYYTHGLYDIAIQCYQSEKLPKDLNIYL